MLKWQENFRKSGEKKILTVLNRKCQKRPSLALFGLSVKMIWHKIWVISGSQVPYFCGVKMSKNRMTIFTHLKFPIGHLNQNCNGCAMIRESLEGRYNRSQWQSSALTLRLPETLTVSLCHKSITNPYVYDALSTMHVLWWPPYVCRYPCVNDQ